MQSLLSLCGCSVLSLLKHLKLGHAAILCVLLQGLPFHAVGQEATIVGTITDPSGSVVPNVKITITNVDTGLTRTSMSNDTGQYVVPDLHIGKYNIKAEVSGFKVAERNGLALNVGDRVRLDFQMQMGAAQETVSVEADALRIQADSGEISDVITGQQVTQLATNGRSIYTLINLTPGASSLQGDFQTPTPVGGDSNTSFNGNRPGHNIYLLDGGEDLDRGGAGNFSVMPSIESLAEFRALTSSYSSEYGLSSAATLTTVLKSGTKQFHASAWEFHRNDAFNARGFFNPAPQTVTKLRFHTYGFNVGGEVPVWKSHPTFFFYNMEWRSLIQGGSLNQQFPLASTYGGNFTSLIAVQPTTVLHVPDFANLSAAQQARFTADGLASGAAFPGNTIPANLLDANAKALLAAGIFPAPGSDGIFHGGNDSPTKVREEIARVDHQFSDKFSIFGHWVSEQISQGYGTTQWSGDNSPAVGDTFGNPSYSAVVHATYVINPALVNEAAFNYNGNRINIIPTGLFTAPSGFGFNRVFTGPNALSRIPSIALSTGTGGNYTANWTPWVNKADDYQIRDDVSWTRGRHQIKMGGSWALYKKIQNLFANTEGNFGFNGFYTGNGFADYLLGYANSYSEDAVQDSGHWNNVSWGLYVQDNWRVNNRLTLNLGLRWDGVPHTYEANSRMSNFYSALYDPAKAPIFLGNGTISPASPGLGTSPNPILAGYQFYVNGIGVDGKNGIPKGLVDNHWAAFGPRLGFAYDLTGRGKTVVRGGFAIMYERIQGNDVYNGGTNVPFSASGGFSNVLLSNPKTSVGGTGSTIAVPPLPIPVASITGIDRQNYKLPVSYQFNIGVQHSLGSKSVLSVSYVGNQNRHQNDFRETNLPAASALTGPTGLVATGGVGYNQMVPFLGFRSIKQAENEANAHYNSLQIDLHANVRNDLQLQFGYTLSRAIDPTTGGGNGFDLDPVSNPYVGWTFDVGPSIFDRTHVAFTNFVYQIPLLKNSQNRALKTALGGWEVSGIVTMESGAPINISQGGTSAGSVVRNASQRPNLTGAISYPKSSIPGVKQGIQWFDPTAFTAAAQGTFGNLGHDALRGPGRDNWNIALFKTFVFSETRGSKLELRFESFNTWNHAQFRGDVQGGGIVTSTTDARFGRITAAYDPRTLQLGAKLVF